MRALEFRRETEGTLSSGPHIVIGVSTTIPAEVKVGEVEIPSTQHRPNGLDALEEASATLSSSSHCDLDYNDDATATTDILRFQGKCPPISIYMCNIYLYI